MFGPIAQELLGTWWQDSHTLGGWRQEMQGHPTPAYRVRGASRLEETPWTAETARSHMASLEEGLGHIMCVAGALEYEGPFLGLLHRIPTLQRTMRAKQK